MNPFSDSPGAEMLQGSRGLIFGSAAEQCLLKELR